MSRRRVKAVWMGCRPYRQVHELQHQLHQARLERRMGDVVLLLEHTPVITQGRKSSDDHILVSNVQLQDRGIDLVQTNRGGDVTYHGPGQLVAYPIVDLAPNWCDVRAYVKVLLETMILLAAEHGVGAGTITRHPGVWVDRRSVRTWPGEQSALDPAKLGAVGVRISQWVTMHGFALNVHTDLRAFEWIIPCGIQQMGVTSLTQLVGSAPEVSALAPHAATHLCELLGADIEWLGSFDGALDRFFAWIRDSGPHLGACSAG